MRTATIRMAAAVASVTFGLAAQAELALEKDELKLGFIKLTDMAPLAVAYELGYFEDEGLFVTLEPQANWKVLLDRVITGELDGAHMLAGQPLAATIGFGTQAHVVTAFSMDLNGNGITVSNAVWAQMKPHVPKDPAGKPVHPISARALAPVVEAYRAQGKSFNMGMVFPVSTHNYELRYWLAAGGIHPGFYSPSDATGQIDADVLLSVTPPPQVPANPARYFWPLCFEASSMARRVSLVNLQKLTLKPCGEPASVAMLAPAQNTRSWPLLMTTARTWGCSKRSRSTASASSMSTPRS